RWSWPAELLDEADVAELAGAWFEALGGILVHARQPGAGGHSPSDFALARLGQGEIDALEARVDLTEIWPLTPMAEGLAFHTLYDRGGADVYTVQLVLELTGLVAPPRLNAALAALLARHPNLRASFVQVASG